MQERFSVRDERRGSAPAEMRQLSARGTPRSHYYTLILIDLSHSRIIMSIKPLVVPALKRHTATVIVAHGLGDSGAGWYASRSFVCARTY
jgi:hypothetical protein